MPIDEKGTPIIDVDATARPDGNVRLKYVAISGYTGPEIIMTRSLAVATIEKLQEAIRVAKLNRRTTHDS